MGANKSAQAKHQKRGQPQNRGQFAKQERQRAEAAEPPTVDLDCLSTGPALPQDETGEPLGGWGEPRGPALPQPEAREAQIDLLVRSVGGDDELRRDINAAMEIAAEASKRLSADEGLRLLFEDIAKNVATQHIHEYLGGYFDDPFEIGVYEGGREVVAESLDAWRPTFNEACRQVSCEPLVSRSALRDDGIEFLAITAGEGRSMPKRSGPTGVPTTVQADAVFQGALGENLHVRLWGNPRFVDKPVATVTFSGFLPVDKIGPIAENRWDKAFDGLHKEIQANYS